MSNQARRRQPAKSVQRQPAKSVQRQRPLGELKVCVRIKPPDGPTDAAGEIIPADIEIDLRQFTLAERQLAKQAMSKFAAPHEMIDVVTTHAWVVWRRTNPSSSLQFWMDHITFGDLLDSLSLDPDHVQWDTTPEGYDPNR